MRRMVTIYDDEPAAIARNAIDTLRDLRRKMHDEVRRKSNHTPAYTALEDEWNEMAGELAEALLDAALYWSGEETT